MVLWFTELKLTLILFMFEFGLHRKGVTAAGVLIVSTIPYSVAPEHLGNAISTGRAQSLVFGTGLAFTETVAGNHRPQFRILTGRALLGLAILMATEHADAILAGRVLKLATYWIANIVLYTRTEIVLNAVTAIPEFLILALAYGGRTGSRDTITDVALCWLALFHRHLSLNFSCSEG